MRFRKRWKTHRCVVERPVLADGVVGGIATVSPEETESFDFRIFVKPERDEMFGGGSRRGIIISKDLSI